MVYDVLAPNRRHVTSSHHADYSMHYCNVKWPSWQLPANRMFVQHFFQIANKEKSKVHVTVPLWGDSIVIGGSPHKRRVTWKISLFDDVIMDWRIPWGRKYHVTQCTRCITAIKQTMLERGRNVDIPLVSLLSLGSIPRDNNALCKQVKSSVTTTLLGVEGVRTGWKRDYLKVLQGKLLKFLPDLNQIWCAHWVGV